MPKTNHATDLSHWLYYFSLMVLDRDDIALEKGIAMGSGFAQLDRITADIQANDLQWVEVADGSYFKALTVHVPTHTVAYAFRMDPGAPDFPSHFHICRALSFTTKGWFGYREGSNRVDNGMFSYEAPGSFHTPFSDCPEGFEARGIFESDSEVLLQNHVEPNPNSDILGLFTVQDFLDIAAPETHVVHADGSVTGDPHFKYDFSGGIEAP
ncbi:MAG: hypothetical protein ACI8Z1_001375 [Candidatus Azotimanducaceae bacterium]|jgi:hypothetical protein